MLNWVIQANNEDYDAMILACYRDPALEASREISEIPVWGIGEMSMHFAAMLGKKFSVITDLTREIPWVERDVRRFGLEVKFAEAMFDYKKSISKVAAYQKPEPKPLTNLPAEFEVTK